VALLLSWRDGISAGPTDKGGVRIERGDGDAAILLRPAPAVAEALFQLAPPGFDEDRLADLVLAADPRALAGWYYALQVVATRGLVCRSVWASGRRLATLLSATPSLTMAEAGEVPGRRHRLSQFAYLRRDGEALVVETSLAGARVVIDDVRACALIGALAAPSTAAELAARASDLPAEAVRLLLALLDAGGMLDDAEVPGNGGEPVVSARDAWEFHDLLFHARSRRGRCHLPVGATYRLAGRMELPPAIKPAPAGKLDPLARPDLETLQREDPPLSWVIEHRRSIREYGARPLSARQLGEFFYRVARVRDLHDVVIQAPHGPMPMTIASRPYPSGGALYELEFYAAIAHCDGLAPGFYYYTPQDHGLITLGGPSAEVTALLHDAAESAGMPADTVQVLVVLAARPPRISWKYASIAYSLILKHVGVVYETMYLAATAMGLAPCALGCGDSDAFARAAGTDYYAETSVGEFLLGSLPDPKDPPPHPGPPPQGGRGS
jgi:SagB-type dehydrogenase family enzyme